MDLNNVSIEQLKRLLSVLKLSTTGTKRQLILRLNNIPKEIRGQFEEMARQKGDKDGENSKGEDSGDENFEDDGETIQKEGDNKSNSKGRDKSNGKDGAIQSYNEEDGGKSNGKDGGIQSYDEEDGKDGERNDEVAGSILRIRDKRNENYTEDDMHNQAGENSRNAKAANVK